jgi:LysR family transcriptional regulator, transcriptional activator of nhaA
MKPSAEIGFLNYHHLRYFWTVASEGSFKRASEKLSVSQPSMCTQIKLLESSLGETLFRPSGRSLELTEFGQIIHGYAEEIFTLGGEILRATKQVPGVRGLRLHVGIVDSFPKLMSYNILRPVLEHQPPVQLTCHEGKLPDLVSQLNTHRVDVVLSDEPASPRIAGKVFNHLLATSEITFCAMPGLAKKLKGRFPRNLDGAPALLPTQNCSLRRDLENWFSNVGVQPQVVAEFEDAALTKVAAINGHGFIAVPTVVASEAVDRYGFVKIGRTKEVVSRFYAITAERRFTHPAILAMTEKLRPTLKKRSRSVGNDDPEI